MRGKRQRALSLAYSAVQIPLDFCVYTTFSPPPLLFPPYSTALIPATCLEHKHLRSGTRWLIRRITRLLLERTTGHPRPLLVSHSVIPPRGLNGAHITCRAGPILQRSRLAFTHCLTLWNRFKRSHKGPQSESGPLMSPQRRVTPLAPVTHRPRD